MINQGYHFASSIRSTHFAYTDPAGLKISSTDFGSDGSHSIFMLGVYIHPPNVPDRIRADQIF